MDGSTVGSWVGSSAETSGIAGAASIAILAAVLGQPDEVPFSGRVSWLYAGEAAAAFIAAVSRDQQGAPDFDLNGACEEVDIGLAHLRTLAPGGRPRSLRTV